jgi:DNA-binding CsgD family transcriptional regulator/tetratricopeptide (TPR) repeat protein
VRDAVMARAHSVSQRARGVMELAAMVPPRIERWLVDELLAPPGSAIDECLVTGMVQGADGALAFRHELARRAIADAMPPERQRTLHADCLAALLGRENAVAFGARIVHHAEGAGDSAAVLAHAPFAAAQAAAVGAHREAAALYGRALRASYDLQPSERASLLERYSMQCYLSEPIEAACDARAEAITLWRAVGDRLREGDALRWLSRLWWIRGDRAKAERFAAEAIAVLETLPPGHELAMAYSNRAQLAMLIADADATIEWGTRALAIAEPAGDTEVVVHTMINVGTAESTADRPGGIEKLQRGLAIALANDQPEQVARGYANLATHFLKKCDYDRAAVYLRDGLAYFDERDMSSWSLYLLSWRAHVHFERGEWAQAEADASSVVEQGSTTAISRIHALVVLARLRMHKSEKGSDALLDEARDAAVRTGERQRILHVSAARAESAWLAGDLARTGEEAALGWAMAAGGMRWEVGQLALMLWRANRLTPLDATLPLAVERQVAGDWRAASTEWKRLGSPLQEALAMAESDDADALRYAFDLLVNLGSKAGCALVRRRMRALGLRGIRRGERASTRSNPARLTTRQLEILALLCEGLRDAEIATQCFLSTKTVGHHVSAILGKLGVRSRGEASAAARAMGIVAPQ